METLRAHDVDFPVRIARLADDSCVVAPAGELDLSTAAELASALERLDGRAAHRVIVDLTAVTFLDSTALGALVREARVRIAAGSGFEVICDDPRTLRALEVIGLRSVFPVHRTLRDALDPPVAP